MNNSFEPGQEVRIKTGTWHDISNPGGFEKVTFFSYMAGRQYAVLTVKTFDGYGNIRVNVEDLESL